MTISLDKLATSEFAITFNQTVAMENAAFDSFIVDYYGDQVPYIFSPALCRRTGDKMTSDMCNSYEFCYTHRHFAFCCNNRAFAGQGPVGGKFTMTGIGGPKKHIAESVVTVPPPKPPTDCNTQGDRRSSRRSDCDSPGFPVESVNATYPTLQQCMDARFARRYVDPYITQTSAIVMNTAATTTDPPSHSVAGDLRRALCKHLSFMATNSTRFDASVTKSKRYSFYNNIHFVNDSVMLQNLVRSFANLCIYCVCNIYERYVDRGESTNNSFVVKSQREVHNREINFRFSFH
ncbi:hypothetical protein OSTOST_10731 [Ostertagia ostertagi]